MKNYIFTANSANMLPTRYVLSSELFIACYKKIVKKVIPCIITKRFLNFTTNETFYICKE